MDEQDIYANAEGPSGPHVKWERVKSSENIYQNEDTCCSVETDRTGPALSALQGSSAVRSCSYRASTVILGLLCLLLLVGLITVCVLYNESSSTWETKKIQLQTICNNLTEEKDQLQTSYNDLTKEKDQLQTSYNNLAKEKDQLRTRYNNLTEEKDQLQTSYNNLTEEKDQLRTSYNNLTEEKDQLQTSYNNLTKEKDQLQTNYKNLTEEKDQLQTSFNNLTEEKDQLQTSFNNLTEEKDQLQTSFNNLTEEKDQLQTNCNNLTEEKHQLHKQIQDIHTELQKNLEALHSYEWKYFAGSFYYISSTTKSWQESRNDCLQKESHLVIINSPEEQEFIRSWKKPTWIGLTDAETEGTWKWVDGTLLGSQRYWAESEPNNSNGNENCAEMRNYALEMSWNDVPCDFKIYWICEVQLNN